jgi:hypothetical protein
MNKYINNLEVSKISKNKLLKIFTIISVLGLLSLAIMAQPASALISQNVKAWFWTSDSNVAAIATGDVNGDGKTEIVSVGYYSDGTRYNAQLVVWNASSMAVENVASWFWTSDTQISSVAIGDVNGDGQTEIITGGSYFDGTRWNAQLCVWNGTSLALERVMGWFWTSDTEISSVAVANITGTVGLDIVTGGGYFNGTVWNAQLCVWSGSTLTLERVIGWVWTSNTVISSVATGDVLGNGAISIVTGGSYFDGIRYNAQICIFNGATLALNNVVSWFWTSDTEVNSVAIANVTGAAALNVVVGGDYNDGTRLNSQLTEWDASTLVLQHVYSWFTTSNTKVTSVAVGNFSVGTSLDIVTAGLFNDGLRNNAQLIDFNGATLLTNSATNWFVTSDTNANSAAIGNFGLGNRIAVGGSFFDGTRVNAQLSIWG